MNKKEYLKPSMKVLLLDSTVSILAGSDPISKKIFDDPIEEYKGDEKPSGWGEQW